MQKNKYTNLIIVIIITVALGVMFAWPKINDPNKEVKNKWGKIGVNCINEGVTQLAQHLHPRLKITVQDNEEEIPADIGMVGACTAELHTHDGTGEIHVESPRADEKFTLEQFMIVWDKPIEREGYSVKIKADGAEIQNPQDLIFKDKQEIVIEYTK